MRLATGQSADSIIGTSSFLLLRAPQRSRGVSQALAQVNLACALALRNRRLQQTNKCTQVKHTRSCHPGVQTHAGAVIEAAVTP